MVDGKWTASCTSMAPRLPRVRARSSRPHRRPIMTRPSCRLSSDRPGGWNTSEDKGACEPWRRVGHGRLQAVQRKGGGGFPGMSQTFLSARHVTNESRDADIVVIFRQLCLQHPRRSRHRSEFLAVLRVFRIHVSLPPCARTEHPQSPHGPLPRHCPPKNDPRWARTSLFTLSLARERARTP